MAATVESIAAGPAVAGEPHQVMSDAAFSQLSERIDALCGIQLPARKRQLVVTRLRKRLRALNMVDFEAYLAYLDSPAGEDEAGELINVITTNLTAFFREGHHFPDLVNALAPPPGAPRTGRRLRIWSAACSTGEEPYSIAMAALHAGLAAPGTDLRILATDLDTNVLRTAEAAVYPHKRVETCPVEYRKRYFETLPDGQARVVGQVRQMIRFNQLNLHEQWPVKGPFDAIFCRNVLIYFDDEAKQSIVSRFVTLLRPGGSLYLGHSESMIGNRPELIKQGRTIFRRQP